jgi:hypothetical protein
VAKQKSKKAELEAREYNGFMVFFSICEGSTSNAQIHWVQMYLEGTIGFAS